MSEHTKERLQTQAKYLAEIGINGCGNVMIDAYHLRRQKLNYAKLNGPELNYTKLNGPELNYAKLNGPELNYAKLNGPELNYAKLNGPELNGGVGNKER